MLGTFAGALYARHVQTGPEGIRAEVTGEIETESKVLVVKRIHVTYQLSAAPEYTETIERVRATHAAGCPVARSIGGCIAITTSVQFNDRQS